MAKSTIKLNNFTTMNEIFKHPESISIDFTEFEPKRHLTLVAIQHALQEIYYYNHKKDAYLICHYDDAYELMKEIYERSSFSSIENDPNYFKIHLFGVNVKIVRSTDIKRYEWMVK